MSEKFEVVNRSDVPEKVSSASALVQAVLNTAGGQNAVKVTLNGEPLAKVKQRIYMSARARGLSMRTRVVEPGSFYAWVVKREARS
jgi:hypothetical protein